MWSLPPFCFELVPGGRFVNEREHLRGYQLPQFVESVTLDLGVMSLSPTLSVEITLKKRKKERGTWVAQSVKRPTLGFSSGHDLTVYEFEPHVKLCADNSEPGACFRFCVSLSLWPSPAHVLSLSVAKMNKNILK